MKQEKIYAFAILCAVLAVTLCFSIWMGEQRIRKETNRALREAATQHYAERVEILQHFSTPELSPYFEYYVTAPVYKRKIKSYELRTWKDATVFVFKDSVDETKARRLLNEHILAKANPINIDKLNTIFRAQLSQWNIGGATGTIYYHKKETQYSHNAMPEHAAYLTPVYPLDITGDIKVQGWVRYDLITLLRYIDKTFYLTLLLASIGMGLWLYLRKKRKAITSEPDIIINKNKQELVINGIRCTATRLDIELFSLLAERKGECVSREEIKQHFWSTDLNADEKIDTHIKTLRKALKDFPAYQIVTVRGRGYYLHNVPSPAESQ